MAPERIIDSGDVSRMVDSSAVELLSEIQKRHARPRWHLWYLLAAVLAFVVAAAQHSTPWVIVTLAALLLVTPVLWVFDRRRKTIELQYNLDPPYAERYRRLLGAFQAFSAANRVWVIESEAEVRDRKYHAGATASIKRIGAAPRLELPPYFRSNIRPPMVPAGRQTLYLFPDTVLVFDGSRVGAVGYDQLDTDAAAVNFVEEELPPRDSRQVTTTWRYVNKGGGPDRRFSDNRQLPVMEYGVLRCRSASGLNEEFQTSRPDAAAALDQGLRSMRSVPRRYAATC